METRIGMTAAGQPDNRCRTLIRQQGGLQQADSLKGSPSACSSADPGGSRTKSVRQTFNLTLEALDGDLRPPEVRLRQLLKLAIRGFRMRCVEVKGVRIPVEADAAGTLEDK